MTREFAVACPWAAQWGDHEVVVQWQRHWRSWFRRELWQVCVWCDWRERATDGQRDVYGSEAG